MRDRYVGMIFLAAAAILYYLSYDQIMDVGTAMEGVRSPKFFPQLTIFCMAVFSIILIVQDLVRGTLSVVKREAVISRHMLILIGIAAGFVLSIKMLGYFVSAPLLIIVTMIYLGERNWRKIILLASIFSGALYLFFEKFLEIFLPRGELIITLIK
ncbi:MAG: tripartite tricarboxylate transporter TctB family protein [Deltaproteobacteria bacterium]|nr:tripartite tricarboxylate transporter TctB family protein [Deltaproteobacteria bacterium]